jgi:hypothetical protein
MGSSKKAPFWTILPPVMQTRDALTDTFHARLFENFISLSEQKQ